MLDERSKRRRRIGLAAWAQPRTRLGVDGRGTLPAPRAGYTDRVWVSSASGNSLHSKRRQSMRIGLFYQIQVPKPWTASSESERIYEALEQIPFAEQQGFSAVWFSEHHFRPVWSHNSAPDLTLAAVSQRTERIRLGIGVVLAPIHHPLHVAQRMATLDILSHGRVDVGIGRTGYPYQLTPYGTDLRDTRGMWQEFAEVLPRIWTEEEVSYDGDYYKIPRREGLPKPLPRPHPPLWSACGSDET